MKFEGVMPALITPITAEGKLNVPVLEKLVSDLIDQGADGFYVCGATGEGLTIDKTVHMDMTRGARYFRIHRIDRKIQRSRRLRIQIPHSLHAHPIRIP